jgi:hypothetical protein
MLERINMTEIKLKDKALAALNKLCQAAQLSQSGYIRELILQHIRTSKVTFDVKEMRLLLREQRLLE